MTKKLLSLGILTLALLASSASAGDKDKGYSSITVTVVREWNGKPVRNAAVILAEVDKKGRQHGGLNLKTDAEGVAKYDGVPYGKLRVQVIAQGMQTYGGDIVIDESKEDITIQMKKPQDQHSIYGDEKKKQ